MKNQNDMIVMIVTIALALIAITAFFFTKPQPVQPPQPEAVIVAKPALPTGDVQFANALPGAGNAGSGGGGGPRGGGGGGGMSPTLEGRSNL